MENKPTLGRISPQAAKALLSNLHPRIKTINEIEVTTYKLNLMLDVFNAENEPPVILDKNTNQVLSNAELIKAIYELDKECLVNLLFTTASQYFTEPAENETKIDSPIQTNENIDDTNEVTPANKKSESEKLTDALHELDCYKLDGITNKTSLLAYAELHSKIFQSKTRLENAFTAATERHLNDDAKILSENAEFILQHHQNIVDINNKKRYITITILMTTFMFMRTVLHATDEQLNNFCAAILKNTNKYINAMYTEIHSVTHKTIDGKEKSYTRAASAKIGTFRILIQTYLDYTYQTIDWHTEFNADKTAPLIDILNQKLDEYRNRDSNTEQSYAIGDIIFDTKNHEVQHIRMVHTNDQITCVRPSGRAIIHRKNKIGLNNELVVIKEDQSLYRIKQTQNRVTNINAYVLKNNNSEQCILLQNSMILAANSKDTSFKANKAKALGNTSSTKSVAKTQNIMHCRDIDEAICACTNGNFLQYEAQQIWPTLED